MEKRWVVLVLVLIVAGVFTVSIGFSDTPLPGPSEVSVKSPDGTKCVVSDSKLNVSRR